jgi:hypothetical protein
MISTGPGSTEWATPRETTTMNTLSRNGGLWIAVGTAAGVVIGAAFGVASVGLALGLLLGIAGGFVARR